MGKKYPHERTSSVHWISRGMGLSVPTPLVLDLFGAGIGDDSFRCFCIKCLYPVSSWPTRTRQRGQWSKLSDGGPVLTKLLLAGARQMSSQNSMGVSRVAPAKSRTKRGRTMVIFDGQKLIVKANERSPSICDFRLVPTCTMLRPIETLPSTSDRPRLKYDDTPSAPRRRAALDEAR
jgi:hypothetical protein